MVPMAPDDPLTISRRWSLLGPFQIGTREANWGADSLEYYDGFRSLEHDESSTYPSVLAPQGSVSWQHVDSEALASSFQAHGVSVKVSFPDVDWVLLQKVYGWAALQYQCWVRGYFEISSPSGAKTTIALHVSPAVDVWIDDEAFCGGDLYGYHKAPIILHLETGKHRIDARLAYDVRFMGGKITPDITLSVDMKLPADDQVLLPGDVLLSDAVDGVLVGNLVSVTVTNGASYTVRVTRIEDVDNHCESSLLNGSCLIAPGQTRAIPFALKRRSIVDELRLEISYKRVTGSADTGGSVTVSGKVNHRHALGIQKVTHRHPSGIISYSMLRPPPDRRQQNSSNNKDLPVFLFLHGAGDDADDPNIFQSLDPLIGMNAWLLIPQGVTPLAGDDWHNWGYSDAVAAINAIPDWINMTDWKGCGVKTEVRIVTGHSNGGQGVWYFATHHPDKTLVAVPVSGYASINLYVPFALRNAADPRIGSVLDGSMNSYRHELQLENLRGIPIMLQHGSDDDNVPVYHARWMAGELQRKRLDVEYHELPGVGHWFKGVMTTPHLTRFYERALQLDVESRPVPSRFTFICANPADTGSMYGLRIVHLDDPGQLGRVSVEYDDVQGNWLIRTSNIAALTIPPRLCSRQAVHIDDCQVAYDSACVHETGLSLAKESEKGWKVGTASLSISHRAGRQLGGIEAILRTTATITIETLGPDLDDLAVEISRNLFQYYRADSEILIARASAPDDSAETGQGPRRRAGNSITVAVSSHLPTYDLEQFPIQVCPPYVRLQTSDGGIVSYATDEAVAAIFLRPRPAERLELVVWGQNKASVVLAARLIPILTGTGQADFVILGKDCAGGGAAGVLAIGFFNQWWRVTGSSFLR